MYKKQKSFYKIIVGFISCLVVSATFAIVNPSGTVKADTTVQCPVTGYDGNNRIDNPPQCVINNFCIVASGAVGCNTGTATANGVTFDEYKNMVFSDGDGCEGRGNILGIGGASVYSCSNAVSSCLVYAVNVEACSNGELMAGLTGASTGNKQGSNCEYNEDGFRAYGDMQQCLESLNKDSFNDLNDEFAVACDKRPGMEEADTIRCAEQTQQIKDICQSEHSGYTKEDFAKYQQCMNQKSLELANTAQECKDRGGIPKNDNAGYSGCDAPLPPDLSEECADRGGVDPNDSSRCVDGTEPDKEAECPKTDADGNCVGIKSVSNRCGDANVNILVCGEAGGNVALNNVLKIGVIILSIVVGIAAVGGLAWASILYSKAEENEGSVSEAKTLIQNIVVGLILYVLLVALINWLVPGGVF